MPCAQRLTLRFRPILINSIPTHNSRMVYQQLLPAVAAPVVEVPLQQLVPTKPPFIWAQEVSIRCVLTAYKCLMTVHTTTVRQAIMCIERPLHSIMYCLNTMYTPKMHKPVFLVRSVPNTNIIH